MGFNVGCWKSSSRLEERGLPKGVLLRTALRNRSPELTADN